MIELKSMKIILNNYYFIIIKDILEIIKTSENGKIIWFEENDEINYSLSTKSTYPDFLRFYFIKTPKKERISYLEINKKEPFEDGYFNGNKRELLIMFENALKGKMPKSKRNLKAFDLILSGYFQFLNDYFEEYQKEYYNFDDLDMIEFPF